ncbi:MAG TPA: hypothetical protein VIJ29_04305 [Candidatus Paceibacterota bacterium]
MDKQTIVDSKSSLLNSSEEILLAVSHQIDLLEEWCGRLDVADYLARTDKELAKTQFVDLLRNLRGILGDIHSYKVQVGDIGPGLPQGKEVFA